MTLSRHLWSMKWFKYMMENRIKYKQIIKYNYFRLIWSNLEILLVRKVCILFGQCIFQTSFVLISWPSWVYVCGVDQIHWMNFKVHYIFVEIILFMSHQSTNRGIFTRAFRLYQFDLLPGKVWPKHVIMAKGEMI